MTALPHRRRPQTPYKISDRTRLFYWRRSLKPLPPLTPLSQFNFCPIFCSSLDLTRPSSQGLQSELSEGSI